VAIAFLGGATSAVAQRVHYRGHLKDAAATPIRFTVREVGGTPTRLLGVETGALDLACDDASVLAQAIDLAYVDSPPHIVSGYFAIEQSGTPDPGSLVQASGTLGASRGSGYLDLADGGTAAGDCDSGWLGWRARLRPH
jgi:hypothetical protein